MKPSHDIASMAPVGRIGRYEVLGRLATGGMAEVFLARSTGARDVAKQVVIKRLLPHIAEDASKIDEFVQEARLCSRLSHPNLCAVHEFGDDRGAFYLVMEWVRGPSMRMLIERLRKLELQIPVEIAARIGASLANALHHAHVATGDDGKPLGIVHRDVTPENVIVGWNGVPKLIDFGIAKSSVDPRKTQSGVLKGKLAYVSPEQYRGETLDGRSDVFALGACMYELLTCQAAFERPSEFEVLAAIVVDPTVPSIRAARPDVPEELEAIVHRALMKFRGERSSSAEALGRELESWLAARGQPVGEREVAAFLEELFPGRAAQAPKLDRTPIVAKGGPPPRSESEGIEALRLGAEADLDADAIEAGQRRSRGLVFATMMIVALAAIAVIAWTILRPH